MVHSLGVVCDLRSLPLSTHLQHSTVQHTARCPPSPPHTHVSTHRPCPYSQRRLYMHVLCVWPAQVQFWQDRPQLFAKMSKPHSFGFLLYRISGSVEAAREAQPLQVWNTTQDSHYAAERLLQLHALRMQAIGHATGAGRRILCV